MPDTEPPIEAFVCEHDGCDNGAAVAYDDNAWGIEFRYCTDHAPHYAPEARESANRRYWRRFAFTRLIVPSFCAGSVVTSLIWMVAR